MDLAEKSLPVYHDLKVQNSNTIFFLPKWQTSQRDNFSLGIKSHGALNRICSKSLLSPNANYAWSCAGASIDDFDFLWGYKLEHWYLEDEPRQSKSRTVGKKEDLKLNNVDKGYDKCIPSFSLFCILKNCLPFLYLSLLTTCHIQK